MSLLRAIALLAALCGLVAAVGTSAAAPAAMWAGGDRHAWAVWAESERGRSGARLWHIPGDAPPGSLREGPDVGGVPRAMASYGSTVFMVFGAEEPGGGGAAGGEFRRVRRVEIDTLRAGVYGYSRPEALPPLPGDGALLGLAATGRGPVAMLGPGPGDEGGPRLLRLEAGSWQPLSLPPGLSSDGAARAGRGGGWRLIGLAGGVGIIEMGSSAAASGSRLWRWARPDDPASWESAPVAVAPGGAVLTAGDQIVRAVRPGDSALLLQLVRGDRAVDLREFGDVPPDAAVVGLGDRLAIVWREVRGPEAGARAGAAAGVKFRVRMITLGGTDLYDGPADLLPSVTFTESLTLALMAGSMVLGLGVLVVRPGLRGRDALGLPPGVSLAEPLRRMFAGSVDLLPGFLAASGVARAMGWDADASAAGVTPLLIVAGVTIAHSAIGEALAGVTMGKLLARCRTVRPDGARPRWWQAVGRNTVKILCPPLWLLVLMNPAAPQPGGFGTWVVVDDAAAGGAGRG
ncbi:MAG: RDD family protein [Phycisphaerales bacterium]|nr:RDD family protein [Phycisphaerales bacterium]